MKREIPSPGGGNLSNSKIGTSFLSTWAAVLKNTGVFVKRLCCALSPGTEPAHFKDRWGRVGEREGGEWAAAQP